MFKTTLKNYTMIARPKSNHFFRITVMHNIIICINITICKNKWKCTILICLLMYMYINTILSKDNYMYMSAKCLLQFLERKKPMLMGEYPTLVAVEPWPRILVSGSHWPCCRPWPRGSSLLGYDEGPAELRPSSGPACFASCWASRSVAHARQGESDLGPGPRSSDSPVGNAFPPCDDGFYEPH